MRILVDGAGASVEESIRLGVAQSKRPPLINNFGATLWNSDLAMPLSLYQYMTGFLMAAGCEPGPHPIQTFILLERIPGNGVDVERFFEYAWLHRNEFDPGGWDDLIYMGVFNPLGAV